MQLNRVGPAWLFDHLVRSQQHRLRDRQAERFGSLEVDHELKFSGLLHRQVGGLGASENFVNDYRTTLDNLRTICTVGHEATGLYPVSAFIDRHNPVLGCSLEGASVWRDLSQSIAIDLRKPAATSPSEAPSRACRSHYGLIPTAQWRGYAMKAVPSASARAAAVHHSSISSGLSEERFCC